MSSHVHIGLYDALREAGASEETARAGAVDIRWAESRHQGNGGGREPLIFPLGRISPPRKTCCEPSPRWIGQWRS